METDSQKLLHGLRSYEGALERHRGRLREVYSRLDVEWHALLGVYRGSAAEEFIAYWQTVDDFFHRYLEQSESMKSLLKERIESLEMVDRPEGS